MAGFGQSLSSTIWGGSNGLKKPAPRNTGGGGATTTINYGGFFGAGGGAFGGGGGGGGGGTPAQQLAMANWKRDNEISTLGYQRSDYDIRGRGYADTAAHLNALQGTNNSRYGSQLSGLTAQRGIDAADNAASIAFYKNRMGLQNAASTQAQKIANWKQGSEAVTRGAYGGYGDSKIKADLLFQMQNQIGQQTAEGQNFIDRNQYQDNRSAQQYATDTANLGYSLADFDENTRQGLAQNAMDQQTLQNAYGVNTNQQALSNQQAVWAAQAAGQAPAAAGFGAGLTGTALANFNRMFGKR